MQLLREARHGGRADGCEARRTRLAANTSPLLQAETQRAPAPSLPLVKNAFPSCPRSASSPARRAGVIRRRVVLSLFSSSSARPKKFLLTFHEGEQAAGETWRSLKVKAKEVADESRK